MIDPVLQLAAALTLALVFGVGAVSKMTAWAELEGVVQNFRIVPAGLAPLVARLLPPAELMLAVLVLFPPTRALAGWGMAALLVLFAGAIALNLLRGRVDIDCGCFRSALRQNLSGWLLLRNGLLTGLALACVPTASGRALGWADLFVAVAAAAVLFLAYLSTGYVTLRRPPTFEENFQQSLADRG
jgi:hypothetical protein